jgi:dihydrofolate reductase
LRKIIGAVFQSADGIMQAPGGPDEDPTQNFKYGGWMFAYADERTSEGVKDLFSKPFDLLLGRRTYDIFSAYWPYVEENNPIGVPFNKCRKYVMSRGENPLDWQNSNRVQSIAELEKIKNGNGPDLIIQGSSTLYPQLLKQRLIDELRLMTFPVVLGNGKKLFDEGTPAIELKMAKSEVSPGGVVIAKYQIGGDVKCGSFVPSEPSPRELERREIIKKGQW